MNCRDVQRELYPYMDGEFEVEEAVQFEAHLESCEDCRQLLIFEKNLFSGIREKLNVCEAPSHLRSQILNALENEEEASLLVRFLRWTGMDGQAVQWQFASAFSLSFAVVLGGYWINAQQSGQEAKPEIRPVTASVSIPLPVTGMTPDPQNNAPNPVLSLVSGDLTTSAIGAHLNTSSQGYEENHERVWELAGSQFLGMEPPFRESTGSRLLGARLGGRGLVSSVIYEYDIDGSRVTAIQSVLPRGWGRQGRFYNVERRDGLTVVTFQQSENVLTSLVSSATEDTLRGLVELNTVR